MSPTSSWRIAWAPKRSSRRPPRAATRATCRRLAGLTGTPTAWRCFASSVTIADWPSGPAGSPARWPPRGMAHIAPAISRRATASRPSRARWSASVKTPGPSCSPRSSRGRRRSPNWTVCRPLRQRRAADPLADRPRREDAGHSRSAGRAAGAHPCLFRRLHLGPLVVRFDAHAGPPSAFTIGAGRARGMRFARVTADPASEGDYQMPGSSRDRTAR